MNNFTLQFKDPLIEEQYFTDQFNELYNFYTWACWIGSASAAGVFIMEFISPFGFGLIQYALFIIPISFYFTNRLIKSRPHYFNTIIALMNLSLGFLIDVLLVLFLNTDILFLAGQTVALVQFSLLIGTNFKLNIIILIINQLALVLIDSISKEYFKSLQIMFLLALTLIIKSAWCTEKNKRQFFLLKSANTNLQQTLEQAFKFSLVTCKFSTRMQKVQLIETNNEAKRIFENQDQFTQFIRGFEIIDVSRLTITSNLCKSAHQIGGTLEQKIIYSLNTSGDSVDHFNIYSKNQKSSYIISLYKTIKNQEQVIALLLQKDRYTNKIMILDKQNRKKSWIISTILNDLESVKSALSTFQYQSAEIWDKLSNNPYIVKSFTTFGQLLNTYYNVQLLTKKTSLGSIMQFRASRLESCLKWVWKDAYKKDLIH